MTDPVEILAPAGDESTILAALRAGADAVYFGLDSGFNARARADNIALSHLKGVMDRIHELGRRGYLTLNTLLFDGELERFGDVLLKVADAGVDAVIVQDLGAARWVKALCPSLRLHASTQMTCTDLGSIQIAESLGASRVTLARELSLQEVATLSQSTSVELEIFVHGALCIAYSGQCLTSEAIGGRSANRGACAQACRLPYELWVDGMKRDLGEQIYLLSPTDLDLSQRLPDVIASGIRAIKIEGRLKSVDYVIATTHLYRKALDAALGMGQCPTFTEHEASKQAFSRGSSFGFADGTNHQKLVDGTTCDHIGVRAGIATSVEWFGAKQGLVLQSDCLLRRGDGLLIQRNSDERDEFGGRIWALSVDGRDVEQARAGSSVWLWFGPDKTLSPSFASRTVYRTSSPQLTDFIERNLTATEAKLGVKARLSGGVGQAPVLELVTDDGRHCRVVLDCTVENAKTQALDEKTAFEKLARLGDTSYVLRKLTFELPPGSTLALSSLNRARRSAVDQLTEAAHRSHSTEAAETLESRLVWPNKAPLKAGLFVTCRNLAQAEAAIAAGADGVYLDFLALTGLGPAWRRLRELTGGKVSMGVALPRIRKLGDEKIDSFVLSLSPDVLLVRSLGTLRDLTASKESQAHSDGGGPRPLRIADFSLNVSNSLTAIELLARGMDGFTPSYDLDAAQLPALLDSPLSQYAEVVVHHPMPLFHMEHCVIAALLSTGASFRDCGRPCDRHQISLRDRKGVLLPVEADVSCRNTVFHGKSQSATDQVPELIAQGVGRFRVELLREDAKATEILLRNYRELLSGQCAPVQLRQRLGEAGLSAVRGSLRVIG